LVVFDVESKLGSHTQDTNVSAHCQRLRLKHTIFIHEWRYSLLGRADFHSHQVKLLTVPVICKFIPFASD